MDKRRTIDCRQQERVTTDQCSYAMDADQKNIKYKNVTRITYLQQTMKGAT